MPCQLMLRCAKHSCIVHKLPVDIPHTTIRVEEDDKENQREAQGNLRALVDPKQQNENWREHEAGQRVENLDIWIQNRGPELRSAQQKTNGHTESNTEKESTGHLFHR